MRLKFLDYLIDTGLSYLIYPIVTVGAGLLLSADKSSVEDSEASGHLPGTRTAIPPTAENASSAAALRFKRPCMREGPNSEHKDDVSHAGRALAGLG